MSEQTKQPDQVPQTDQPSSQNGKDTYATVADDVTVIQTSSEDEITETHKEEAQAKPANQAAARELGDPTVPMPAQPATTIQVPAMPADASHSDQSAIENEDTLLNIPPAAATPSQAQDARSLADEKTLIENPNNAEKALQAAPPTPAQAAPAPAATPVKAQPAPAPAPHPFISIEDLAELQLAGEPQVSPDGLLIAYSLLKNDLSANTARATIWLAPAVTNTSSKLQPPRQLTADAFHSTMPRWSPDGHWLAFLSDRTGSLQIYLLPLNGGEPRQVSFLKQPVTEFCWRPDGRALLIQSPWKVEDDQEDTEEETGVQVWTRLDESWDGQGYKHGRHEHLWLLNLEDQQPATRLTFEPVNHRQPCWSPDGKEIAFCGNRRTASDLSVSAALWVLNLASGRMRRLTPLEGLAMQPAWSPDGKWLAYYYTANQSETANVVPWIVEASGQKAPRPATTAAQNQTSIETIIDHLHRNEISRPGWYPDNTSLMVTVQTHGQVHINRLYINTNHEEPLTTGNGCYLSPHLSANGRTIATLRTDWFTPGDVWAMAGNGANPRRLTGVNDTLLRRRQLIRPKKVSWRSFDDLEIEGWLYLPPLPAGTRAPLILDVHGGPTLAWGESFVHDFQAMAGMGYAVLAVNPRGSAGYGEEFCRKVINDWGGDDFRDLMLGLDHVIATEPIDGSRLAITGSSYGGYMTCWAITQTKRFKAAIARNPVTSLLTCSMLSDQWLWFDLIMGTPEASQDAETLRRSCSPLTFADAITTPLLLIHSANDLRCPPSESKQLFNALRRRQHQVELALYPGVSHALDYPGFGSPKQRMDRENRTLEWIKKFV